MIAALFLILGGESIPKNDRSKYNVDLKNKDSRSFQGIVFDSAGEMKMYRDYLLPLQESGEIEYIERQKKFVLVDGFEYQGRKVRPIEYVADFYVQYTDGSVKVFDFKGMPDASAKLKRKMFWSRYPEFDFQWITYSKIDGGYVTYETAQEGRKARAKARKENKENK